MTDNAALLPGTLDCSSSRLFHSASCTATACCCASSRSPTARCRSSRARSTRRSIVSNSRRLIESDWGTSDNNRRAKFYRLTTSGRTQLGDEVATWNRLAEAIAMALRTTRGRHPVRRVAASTSRARADA